MHLTINKDNRVEHMHVEQWDREAFPNGMVEKLMGFKGAPEKEFINFAFTEKLFLYTRILYLMRTKFDPLHPLYLWCHSPIFDANYHDSLEGHARLVSLMDTNYAIFTYKALAVLKPNSHMVAQDELMADLFGKYGIQSELIDLSDIPLSAKESFQLFGLFNMTRNCKNEVRFFTKDNLDTPGELYATTSTKKAYVVALAGNGSLKAFTATDLILAPKEELKTFQSFYFIEPEGEAQENAIGMCRELINDICKEVKEFK